MLDEDLEIIDLTTDVGASSSKVRYGVALSTSTPLSTPLKKHKLDCDVLDAL